jgi:antitoxin HigA-1
MYLDSLIISITALADNLGVARKTVSQLVNGNMGVSAEIALRLGKAFNTTPELWLNLLRNYVLWQAEYKEIQIRYGWTSLRADPVIVRSQ